MWSRCVPDAGRVVRCDARARRSLTKHTTLVDVENAKPDMAHHQLLQPFLTTTRCNQLNIEHENHVELSMEALLESEASGSTNSRIISLYAMKVVTIIYHLRSVRLLRRLQASPCSKVTSIVLRCFVP